MPENNSASIQIGQLNLRIPGNGVERAHGVANTLAQSLAQQVPPGMQRDLGSMNIRVQLAAAATDAEMSNAIANAITNALQNRNRAAKAGSLQPNR
jgi:hypothetical protein